jgi:hypothetical protein
MRASAGSLLYEACLRKTAGREALHRFGLGQQRRPRQGYLEHRCQPRSRFVVVGLQTTPAPWSSALRRGDREAGPRRMQRCGPALNCMEQLMNGAMLRLTDSVMESIV